MQAKRLIERVWQNVAMSDRIVPEIADFFARLLFQKGEVPVFSQLQCLLALNDLTVSGLFLHLGHSLNFPHQKCRYSINRELFELLSCFCAMYEAQSNATVDELPQLSAPVAVLPLPLVL